MGIYIKDMEMPQDCKNCPCIAIYKDCGWTRCRVTGEIVSYDYKKLPYLEQIKPRVDGRADNCPLVEVPTPHGKLIDADKLYATVQSNESADAYVRFLLRHSPTVIEAEGE